MARSGSDRRRRQRELVRARSAAVTGVPAGTVRESRSARADGLRLPGLLPVYDAVIGSADDLLGLGEPLDAERWAVRIWTTVLDGAPANAALDLALDDLLDEAARRATPASLALLRTFAVVGPAGGVARADAAARRLADGPLGAGEPGWTARLGDVKPGACLMVVDPYGEEARLVCHFSYPGADRPHAVGVTVDRAFRGVVTAVALADGEAEVAALVKECTRAAGGRRARTSTLSHRRAAALLVRAVKASMDPELPDLESAPSRDAGSQGLIPLLVQRVEVLRGQPAATPGGAQDGGAQDGEAPDGDDEWPAERRAALVQRFLRERPGVVQQAPAAAMVADRLVDLSLDVLGWPPDRTGPLSAVRMLAEVMPRSLIAPEPVLVDLDRVAPEWFGWLLDGMELPVRDRVRALVVVRQAADLMSRRARDRSFSPERPYVADLPREAAGGDELFAVIERRRFAVPLPGDRGDGLAELPRSVRGVRAGRTHVDDLDAARGPHRELITAIGQACIGTRRQDFPAYVGVVEQLWDDAPREVWPAAQRLTRSGLVREDVLEQLARVWRTFGPEDSGALQAGRVDDEGLLSAYVAALSRLG